MTTKLVTIDYTPEQSRRWDEFVSQSNLSTVLHTRNFLAYHEGRFVDRSVIVIEKSSGEIQGVMPMAQDPECETNVISHPGSTMGDCVTRTPSPGLYYSCLKLIAAHLSNAGYETVTVRPIPSCFGEQPNESSLRLFHVVGKAVRMDLWSTLNLDRDFRLQKKKRASVKFAERAGVIIRSAENAQDWGVFYDILEANLRAAHDTVPTHNLSEILDLDRRLGANSLLLLAESPDGEICAATWLIRYNKSTWHTQYICSTPAGRRLSGVDLLLFRTMERLRGLGIGQLSFGISTLGDGWAFNADLLDYKQKFGGGVIVHNHFHADLQRIVEFDSGQGSAD